MESYDTRYLANLPEPVYEEVRKVRWPWAASKIEFTRGEDRDLDDFGQIGAIDRITSDINNGRMHNITKSITDEVINQETIIIDTQSTDAVKGILEENNLTRLFFSPQNIEAIQNSIRYYVYKLSDGQIISNQSPDELFIVMRSILLQFGNFVNSDVVNEIKRLNQKVINTCSEKVSSQLEQYEFYIDDLQKLPTPLENPHYVNKNNFTYNLSNLPQ